MKTAYTKVKVNEYASHRRALLLAAAQPGARRAEVIAALASMNRNEPAITVNFDTSSVVWSRNGLVAKDDVTDEAKARGFIHPALEHPLKGAAWANKLVGRIVVPSGVCLIVAGGGAGKTPLAHSLAAYGRQEYGVARIGEPLSGYSSDFEVAAASLAEAMLSESDVVLDSIKDLLSSAEGAAMKSGISRGAIASLSAWSSLACELGTTVYVPMNASTDDPAVYAMLAEAARSNATMTIIQQDAGTWQYFTRQGEGLPRTTGEFKFVFKDSDSFGELVPVGSSKSISTSEFETSVSLSMSAWSQAQRRALTPRN